ncbi:shikimate dehydrogenase [Motiliproteus sp. SC1-56]|uniref:shikimate dehydrogenase n=1 Tax=Motiliproteus sp. SC1-56 TaxID=2799565 RepID=UPI001A8EF249|nr:shikimate dehydrogenase [Motiliproteus sp. SC1-56]
MTDRYAVMGDPISHSKSPQIHAAFAAQTGQDLTYEAIRVAPGSFAAAVEAFFAAEGKGLNVTVPFKEEAWKLAGRLSERARLAGAVNTLYRDEDGRLVGDNTDGQGLITDIQRNHGGDIVNKRVLAIGAGGAVRGVLEPLLKRKPGELVIANRTASKAEALAEHFSALGNVRGCGFAAVNAPFDLVINGSAASLHGELPSLSERIWAEGAWAYDMMYGAEPTVFNRWAQQAGAARVMDGLGMLVEQAAEAFRLWRGVTPQTRSVILEMRCQLEDSARA